LASSFFKHDVKEHQALNCQQCHPAAQSRQTQDVLLPGIDNCRQCHAPGSPARFDCIECHRYHPQESPGGHARIVEKKALPEH
jgi:hypothetical protein